MNNALFWVAVPLGCIYNEACSEPGSWSSDCWWESWDDTIHCILTADTCQYECFLTADTVRIHCLVHIPRARWFQEIIHVFKINTHKYIHNTYTLRTQYIHFFRVCIVLVLVCMFVFVCKLLVYTSTIHTNTCRIHTNTYQYMQYKQYNGAETCGRWHPPIQANTCKYMHNTSKIHANTYQYAADDDHRFQPRHECIGSVLACICMYFACICKNNTY